MIQKYCRKYKNVAIALFVFSIICAFGAIASAIEEQRWQRQCDGVTIMAICQDEEGNRYSKYVFHEAEPEITEEIYHPAEPEVTKEVRHPAEQAKTHTVHHDAVYSTRRVSVCIKTNIDYKSGTCALSRCRDGKYSGSSGRGTCSHHGGVWYGGGPWYEYVTETYLVSAAWDEIVVDAPAKEAWTETVVVTPAKEAWTETVVVSPAREEWIEKKLAN